MSPQFHEPGPVERYMDARVPDASTVGDSYLNYHRDPKAFVGGVQHALDKMLKEINENMILRQSVDYFHHIALRILENAKIGEPQ